ncbi:MAG: hypothetical protein IT375_21855 [Polyangiaceae bacterium]|nr:hypothetical protein [Polyangiaceae bacterium]MCK6534597.1 hypothetical protein [Polyangiaceae bacterium]
MTHPLAHRLATLMDRDLEELHAIVAQWVVETNDELERARYRVFGSELGAVQRRISARSSPPSREEIEIALTAVLALSGRRARGRA